MNALSHQPSTRFLASPHRSSERSLMGRSGQCRFIRQVLKLMLFFLLGNALLTAGSALAQTGASQAAGPFAIFGQIQQMLVSLVTWIDSLGPIGSVVFILAYIAVTVAFLPASVVTLGAGFVFGVVKGSTLVFIGAMLGATAAFLVGRFLARDWIAQKVAGNRFFSALDGAIAEEGLKLIFLIRLSPAFPFNLLNSRARSHQSLPQRLRAGYDGHYSWHHYVCLSGLFDWRYCYARHRHRSFAWRAPCGPRPCAVVP